MGLNDRADDLAPVPRDSRDRTMWALRRAGFAVDALKERHLRGTHLTASQYSVLMSVQADPGVSGAELARRLHVSAQAVAPLARRLQERGLLARRSHPMHAHVQELHLTPAGEVALRAAEAAVEDLEQRIEQLLGPEENRRLRELLEKLAEYAGKQP